MFKKQIIIIKTKDKIDFSQCLMSGRPTYHGYTKNVTFVLLRIKDLLAFRTCQTFNSCSDNVYIVSLECILDVFRCILEVFC